jgi:hypothetical protein
VINYTLVCEGAHTFEGWFRNSDDFDAQCDRKLVVCPICGGTKVKKGLMAPAVSTSRKRETMSPVVEVENKPSEPATGTTVEITPEKDKVPMQPSALLPVDVRQKEIVEALRVVRARMIENSENVGSGFAEEARKIHYGEAEERSIHGETTPKDAEDLLEEGIAVLALPELPEEKN